MKEALTLFMLAMLVLPVLIGVRRLRRLQRRPPPGDPR
jgi:hypothetical protein